MSGFRTRNPFTNKYVKGAGTVRVKIIILAMVVVASLIGAKGLGEDVLEALQYANVGQGILAGFGSCSVR